MSRGSVIFVILVLIAAGWYVYTTLVPTGVSYAQIQSGTLGASYKGDALIVRNETPYDAEGVTSVEYVAEEGSMVYMGDIVCYVYSSSYNQREMTALQDYRDQIKDYHQQLLNSESAYDQRMSQLESEVISRGEEVRQLVWGSSGNMLNQEVILDTAIQQRQLYLKTKYADDQKLSRLYDDESAQEQRIQSWTKQYAATAEGIVSFYSDGYEYGLTSTDYEKFSPAEVRSMYAGNAPERTVVQRGATTIYRTVRANRWNVLMLIKNEVWNPITGETYQLKLEGFDNTTVSATVTSCTRASGELLVRLEIFDDVTPVLYMRTCQAELGEYVDSMMVPANAIFTQNGMKGVVTVEGDSQLFVPVEIISTDNKYTYISAMQQGFLYVGQTVRLF